jgi:hypothetical protein
MRLFGIKRNRAIKNWHLRAMVIDLRKTKVTFILDKESNIGDFVEKVGSEDEIIATPVAVLVDPKDEQELRVNRLFCSQEFDEEVEATQVEVYPL